MLSQAVDHGTVLIDTEYGVTNPGVAVELEGQVLSSFDHRHPQVLVDALPKPHIVGEAKVLTIFLSSYL